MVGYLGDFLFAPQRARSPVKSLSGGERNRLLLARLFARPANVLVLDEPTNDLDIDTLELLEDLIQDYAGTVFLVSHDRAFLDAIVTQTFAAEGDGIWHEYAGGYSDWAAYQSNKKETERAAQQAEVQAQPKKSAPAGRQTARKDRLSWKEQRELETLPEKIASLETEQKTLTLRLADPVLYQNAQEAQNVSARLGSIDAALLDLLERWENLESRQTGEPST